MVVIQAAECGSRLSWILISYCKVGAQTSAGVRRAAFALSLDVTREQSLGQHLRSSPGGPLLLLWQLGRGSQS